MSVCASVITLPDFTVAPRTPISASRASLTCGFTTVTTSCLSCSDAAPFNPQNVAAFPSRSYVVTGAEKIVRPCRFAAGPFDYGVAKPMEYSSE